MPELAVSDRSSRYDGMGGYEEKTEIQARELFEAVSHKPDGVFVWIQSRW